MAAVMLETSDFSYSCMSHQKPTSEFNYSCVLQQKPASDLNYSCVLHQKPFSLHWVLGRQKIPGVLTWPCLFLILFIRGLWTEF
jgi:hypothetical protein